MRHSKVKSFTLSELVVVMIITVIIVGIAFTVLNLVKKEIATIEKNYSKTTELLLFEQRLWLDFNRHQQITFNRNVGKIILVSESDTVVYHFSKDIILRDRDTIKSKLEISKLFFQGAEVREGKIDGIKITGSKEIPDFIIFVSKQNDATFFMNKDGIQTR